LPDDLFQRSQKIIAWNTQGHHDTRQDDPKVLAISSSDIEKLLHLLRQLKVCRAKHRSRTLRLERNEQLLVLEHQVISVKRGLIRCMHLLENGDLVLLGIYGEGDLLLGHDPDHCQVTMIAHTDVTLMVDDWQDINEVPHFQDRLMQRLCFMESWATVLTRSSLEARLNGLIKLLAHKFGLPEDEQLLRDLRLTHEHLGQALGCPRPSISRTLQKRKARSA
jgi:CRP-like cAMP-binding protein